MVLLLCMCLSWGGGHSNHLQVVFLKNIYIFHFFKKNKVSLKIECVRTRFKCKITDNIGLLLRAHLKHLSRSGLILERTVQGVSRGANPPVKASFQNFIYPPKGCHYRWSNTLYITPSLLSASALVWSKFAARRGGRCECGNKRRAVRSSIHKVSRRRQHLPGRLHEFASTLATYMYPSYIIISIVQSTSICTVRVAGWVVIG